VNVTCYLLEIGIGFKFSNCLCKCYMLLVRNWERFQDLRLFMRMLQAICKKLEEIPSSQIVYVIVTSYLLEKLKGISRSQIVYVNVTC
jgi:hypothetical protein